ncbi:MAG: hypothetical protein LBB74_09430, partial [Chitinispirillales bacterium]|nr:hypothetical protein [Chitinispirillales bacterium]
MKTKRVKTPAVAAALVLGVLGLASGAFAQARPDTQWVNVTFYDFHSDRSNPEFEQPHTSGLRRGMVANTLDGDNKPTLGSSP